MSLNGDRILCAIEATTEALRSRPDAHWILAFSGGKDSTAALKIILAARRKSRISSLKLTLIYCDTGVENPILDAYVKSILGKLKEEFCNNGSLVSIKILKAPLQDRFFVRIVGRGYPPPTNSFRWCTPGLRIKPVSEFIGNHDPDNTVVVLGLRRAESQQRDRALSKSPEGLWQKQREGRRDYDLFLPILDLRLEEVWDAIFWLDTPQSIHSETLMKIYSEASGECPIIKAPTSAPCASGRFGCWTCTVVRKDKSAKMLIEAGYDQLRPFLEFRDWLAEIRNDPKMRWPRKRNGKPGPGPFTLEARKTILRKIDMLEEVTRTEILDASERGLIAGLWRFEEYPRLSFKLIGSNIGPLDVA
jgi:DNA sulfur modification protein DndC